MPKEAVAAGRAWSQSALRLCRCGRSPAAACAFCLIPHVGEEEEFVRTGASQTSMPWCVCVHVHTRVHAGITRKAC